MHSELKWLTQHMCLGHAASAAQAWSLFWHFLVGSPLWVHSFCSNRLPTRGITEPPTFKESWNARKPSREKAKHPPTHVLFGRESTVVYPSTGMSNWEISCFLETVFLAVSTFVWLNAKKEKKENRRAEFFPPQTSPKFRMSQDAVCWPLTWETPGSHLPHTDSQAWRVGPKNLHLKPLLSNIEIYTVLSVK